MKLDEGLNFQKQSLDLTPLIDIIFLLVLFFAVSTSFISREDLQSLKSNLAEVREDKASLSSELAGAVDETAALRSQLAAADRETTRLEASVASLKRERDRALGDVDNLDSRLAAVENERERQRKRIQVLQEQTRALETSLAERREEADAERRRLNEALSEARGRIEKLEAELADFRELAALDREQLERTLAAQQTLESNLDEVVQDEQLDIKREDRTVILQLSDRILFDSGSAVIKDEGVRVLKDVGNTVKTKLRGMRIQVAGHTDNIPVTPGQGAWSDNWSLSAARAVNVLQLLEEEVGIDPELLSAAGYGEHQPIAGNDTPEGRAKNRRIELVLVPQQQ